jgi:hypothetical protein
VSDFPLSLCVNPSASIAQLRVLTRAFVVLAITDPLVTSHPNLPS